MSLRGTPDLPISIRRQIDEVCDRFEAEWRNRKRPDLAVFLEEATGPAKVRLFRELAAVDVDFRRRDGEAVELTTYRERFPEYTDAIDLSLIGDCCTLPGLDLPNVERSDIREALRDAGYEVLNELGRGGMGIVLRARQTALGREVAVKVIKSVDFASEKELRRFHDEAHVVARLDHPNIVPIHEVGESRGLAYFSMKFVKGESLDRRLVEFASDIHAAARLVATAAEAIHHAHQRGILHRDLKPANILVDHEGSPHVTDFGLARLIEMDGDANDSRAFAGTPAYMSPEQAMGGFEPPTTALDVYGLGAVLYSLLTGRAPHLGDSLTETLHRVREIQPLKPSSLNSKVPRDLDVICLKALEKEPKHRYASAQELANDLNRWLSGRPITARPVGTATRIAMWCRRHPLPAALAAMLLISLIGGFAGVSWKWREASRNATRSAALIDYLAHRVLAQGSTDVNPHGSNFTVRQMLDLVSSRIAGDFQGQPDIEAAIRETVAGAYCSLGESSQAEPHWRMALRLNSEIHAQSQCSSSH